MESNGEPNTFNGFINEDNDMAPKPSVDLLRKSLRLIGL